ncbi:MAG TPA: hypothetical protein PK402_01185 [Tepidisphaeraceae bacterium]|nr:hypothetical protein [Tepidisphaeraceae bacterium]
MSLAQEPTPAALRSELIPLQPNRPLRCMLLAILPLLGIYLLMLNPYWVPSGDGEVYTAIARSLRLGEGFNFNGARAAICPPGWPLVLSWLMRISPEFWFLKLCVMSFMLGSLASMFYIVRRFIDDKRAAGVVFLSGILSTLYPLTYFMHTEGFFCLLTSLSILLAFRIGEKRATKIEYPLMLGCLAMACFARWPGVLNLLLIIPALYRPGVRFLNTRAIVTMVLAIVVSLSTLFITMSSLKMSKTEAIAARDAGGSNEADADEQLSVAETEIVTPTTVATTTTVTPKPSEEERLPDLAKKSSKKSYFTEYSIRIIESGKWFSWLLWQPTRFAQSALSWKIGPHFNLDPSDFVGWSAIALLAYALFRSVHRGEWFWIGLAGYAGGLIVIWPNPNARYFVPVVPIIILGVIVALLEFGKVTGRSRLAQVAGWVFVVTILLANVPLLVYDIHVFRSGDRFYKKYEAGANVSLIEICQQINRDSNITGQIAVNERYENMGRMRYSKFGVRATHLLTGRRVLGIGNSKVSRPPDDDRGLLSRQWATKNDVEYFLYQVPSEPWRVWHFRVPIWFETKVTKKSIDDESFGWTLWQRRDFPSKRYRQVAGIPKMSEPWPTRVPGLD